MADHNFPGAPYKPSSIDGAPSDPGDLFTGDAPARPVVEVLPQRTPNVNPDAATAPRTPDNSGAVQDNASNFPSLVAFKPAAIPGSISSPGDLFTGDVTTQTPTVPGEDNRSDTGRAIGPPGPPGPAGEDSIIGYFDPTYIYSNGNTVVQSISNGSLYRSRRDDNRGNSLDNNTFWQRLSDPTGATPTPGGGAQAIVSNLRPNPTLYQTGQIWFWPDENLEFFLNASNQWEAVGHEIEFVAGFVSGGVGTGGSDLLFGPIIGISPPNYSINGGVGTQ